MKTKGVNDIKPNSHERIKHSRSFDLKFTIRLENEIDYNFFTPFHWHNHIEIIYVLDGTMEFKIQNRTYELNGGDCIIVNSELIHSSRLIGQVSYYLFQFPTSALEGLLNDRYYFIEHPSTSDSGRIQIMLKNMLAAYESQNTELMVNFISRMYEFLSYLVSECQDKSLLDSDMTASNIHKKISNAISYIEKNYRQEISLHDIASKISVSPEYFCRQFKKATDTTLNDYIMSLRIASFYEEFMNTDKKISALMEENGIRNYRIFLREFKKIYGDTPDKIRSKKLESET